MDLIARSVTAPKRSRTRIRREAEGELVQMDGSRHDWLEGRGPWMTLLGAIDDATGKVLALRFQPHEDTLGYQVREGGRARWQLGRLSAEDREVLRRVGYADLPLQWTTWREPALTSPIASAQHQEAVAIA